MITQYDLYDITFALIEIRNNIDYELNADILSKIVWVLECQEAVFDDNSVRRAIATIESLDRNRWNCMYHNNVYVNHRLLKKQDIYRLLIRVCEELKHLLENNNFKKAYDLADCIHCLPEIIADNCFVIPKSYWKIYVRPYRVMWDKTFLDEEEKLCKRS